LLLYWQELRLRVDIATNRQLLAWHRLRIHKPMHDRCATGKREQIGRGKGIAHARVTTAVALSDDERRALERLSRSRRAAAARVARATALLAVSTTGAGPKTSSTPDPG